MRLNIVFLNQIILYNLINAQNIRTILVTTQNRKKMYDYSII